MEKVAYFFIDDVIWVMRDIARQRPASLFDNDFMKMLKKAHDEWGLTVQLNLFYRTDFFYGNDEFTISDMPDIYKPELEAASDWLKMAFHAKQEFPDYPYVNATYEDVKDNYELVVGEIKRFAGEKSVSVTLCPHWLPVSKAGCHALYDCGVKFVSPSSGPTSEFEGDDDIFAAFADGDLSTTSDICSLIFTPNVKLEITDILFDCQEVLYGNFTDEQITVCVDGGNVGGYNEIYSDNPVFVKGREYVLFLYRPKIEFNYEPLVERYYIPGVRMGVFEMRADWNENTTEITPYMYVSGAGFTYRDIADYLNEFYG